LSLAGLLDLNNQLILSIMWMFFIEWLEFFFQPRRLDCYWEMVAISFKDVFRTIQLLKNNDIFKYHYLCAFGSPASTKDKYKYWRCFIRIKLYGLLDWIFWIRCMSSSLYSCVAENKAILVKNQYCLYFYEGSLTDC
jgi:hypothetical protein